MSTLPNIPVETNAAADGAADGGCHLELMASGTLLNDLGKINNIILPIYYHLARLYRQHLDMDEAKTLNDL
jgi:hypothetical protein